MIQSETEIKELVKEPIKEVVQPLETEKKREVISVQVTPEEKRTITRMAVKDCGISVSEFVRTKVFMEQKPVASNEVIENPITDEERLIYEEKISEVNAENKKLKEDIIKLKVAGADPKEKEEAVIVPVDENVLNVHLKPETMDVFNRVKAFREDKFNSLTDKEKLEFIPFEKYLTILMLRGFKRTYYGGVLNSNTGLSNDDIKAIAGFEEINYEEQI